MRTWDIQQGDCLDLLRALPDSCIDAIVTDPPYGLSPDGRCRTWDDIESGRKGGGFMGKQWDAAVPGVTWARECLRVCKPGAWICAFGGQRTIHRLICGLEDAGWMIRDLGAWQQWQGFPKSLAVGKAIDAHHGAEREVVGQGAFASRRPRPTADTNTPGAEYGFAEGHTITAPATDDARKWSGFGTALKPCLEPWTLARKPLDGTVAENVLRWGTGALNVDGCRYGYGDPAWPGPQENDDTRRDSRGGDNGLAGSSTFKIRARKADEMPLQAGRWPANVFACPKASRGEREAGCGHLKGKTRAETVEREPGSAGASNPRAGARRERGAVMNARCRNCGRGQLDGRREGPCCAEPDYDWQGEPPGGYVRNHHPTVKPIAIMAWISRLVGGQPGSLILDPFCGSGTTGIAALREGFRFLGFELDPEYIQIAEARITGDAPLFNRRESMLG